MQKFFSTSKEDGKYCVIVKNFLTGKLTEVKGEVYTTEAEAKQRAKMLNEEYKEEQSK